MARDMTNIYFFYSMTSALTCGALAAYLFIHRQVPGARLLMMLMIAVGQWALAYAFEFKSPMLNDKLFWVRLEYFGAAWTGFFVLVFVLFISGKEGWLTRKRMAALAIIPAITPVLALTNDWHHLLWRQAWIEWAGSAPMVAYLRAPGFWVAITGSYLMLGAATTILFRAYRRSRFLYRKQLAILLFGISLPWLSNALYLFEISPFPHLDLTPLSFTAGGLAFAWGLLRYRLLDIVPAAREAVMDSMDEAVFVLDINDRLIDLNPAAVRLCNQAPSEMLGKAMGDPLPEIFGLIRDNRKNGESVRTETVLGAGPGERVVDLRISPLADRRGKPGGWLSILQDITHRKHGEEALRQSELRFRTITASAQDAIIMMDQHGRVSYWNESAQRIFGYRCDEIIGKDLHRAIGTKAFYQAYRSAFASFKETGSGRAVGRILELTGSKKDGTEFPLELSVAAVNIGGEWSAIGIVRDITHRKQAEAEQEKLRIRLQRAQKMEALGTLAGGVAHDLNNILSGIVSYPDLLLMQLAEDSPLRKPIATMQDSGKKAAAMVQDLLTLARRGVPAADPVDLNAVVNAYLASPEHAALLAVHPGARVVTRLEPALLPIRGSAVHLSKSLMNLVTNAAEAMPRGGTITIASESRYLDRPVPGYDQVNEGDYAILSVADQGIGISAEDRERIFEPFYTRKVMGRSGTGLGMSVVWGTVKDHNGYIDLSSHEGSGSFFSLYFPVSRAPVPRRPAERPVSAFLGQGESILVVDDIAQQRDIAREMLTALNYSVSVVASGEAALAYLDEYRADLVVLDMIMDPGMDGLDTYAAMRKIHPGQKAVIASGYSESDRVRRARDMGAGRYIRKPYTLEKIGTAVRRALDGPSPS